MSTFLTLFRRCITRWTIGTGHSMGSVFLSKAKTKQHSPISDRWYDDVSRSDSSMHNRWLLSMQVANGIYNWGHHSNDPGQCKALIGLLFAQLFQIWPFNTIHEHIDTLSLLILKYALNAR